MKFTPEETVAAGKIPSGLFIVATKNNNKIDGFLGSLIQQVSFQPLLVALAIKPGRPAYDSIMAKNTFTINVAGDHDKSYMKLFWKGYDANENPFDELQITETENQGILLNAAMAALDCRLVETLKPGDHQLVIAEVLQCYTLNADAKPLTHIRKNGLSY